MTVFGSGCELYLITPPALDPELFAVDLASALSAGPVACLQIRLKNAGDDTIRAAAARLVPLCHRHGVPVLMNDRPDLAQETGCDGVHIGQEDWPLARARRLLGPDAIIGVTCGRDLDLAEQAADNSADYVAFGAFFPTATKRTRVRATPDLLTAWRERSSVPAAAIGGITAGNCKPLAAAGADLLAVIAGIWDFDAGPAAAVRAFRNAMDGA